MVASAHPQASLVGAQVLDSGGSAVDAALAMAAMTFVVLPAQCGLGGDAFAVVYDARARTYTSYLGSGFGPDGGDCAFYRGRGCTALPLDGPLAVAVPGSVDCMERLHAGGATRSLEELWRPAVRAARDGVVLSEKTARDVRDHRGKLFADGAASRVYLRGGAVPAAGSVLCQADLAGTLEALARRPRDMYDGELAERCLQVLREGGAPFCGEEWAMQDTALCTALQGRYRDATLHTTHVPTPGYMVLQQAAHLDGMLDGVEWLGADAVHRMATAARGAFDDRYRVSGSDTDAWRDLLAPEVVAVARARLDATAQPMRAAVRDGDTTSLVAVDAAGNAVSFIHSLAFTWGSGVMVPGTGVLLNNRLGRGAYLDESHPNGVRPRRRPMHTLTCFIASDSSGQPLLAGNTPGGDGQVQWTMQLLSHVFDHAVDVQEAVEAPRFTVFPGSDADVLGQPPQLRVEDRVGGAVLAALRERGHEVRPMGPWEAGGGAQLVAFDRAHGTLRGGSDPRQDGCALGV